MGMTMSMEIPCHDQYLEKDLQQYIEKLTKTRSNRTGRITQNK
eukprot:UN13572